MFKHEITVERYRELTKDKIEPGVGSMMLGLDVHALGYFASPRGGVVGILFAKSGFFCDPLLAGTPPIYIKHEDDKFFFVCLSREADDLYHYLRRTGEYVNRETCRDELIGQIDEFVIRGFDRPFMVGGPLDETRGPIPEGGKTRCGKEDLRIIERNGERLSEETSHRYTWNSADQKWHFDKTYTCITSHNNEYDRIYLKCGTVSEIRKNPKAPLGDDGCQFRINGGPWYRYPLSMDVLRKHLRSAKAAEMIDGFELAAEDGR